MCPPRLNIVNSRVLNKIIYLLYKHRYCFYNHSCWSGKSFHQVCQGTATMIHLHNKQVQVLFRFYQTGSSDHINMVTGLKKMTAWATCMLKNIKWNKTSYTHQIKVVFHWEQVNLEKKMIIGANCLQPLSQFSCIRLPGS